MVLPGPPSPPPPPLPAAQPRRAVFEEFTHLLLLGKGGRQVYCGRAELIEQYFVSLGFELPRKENPAGMPLCGSNAGLVDQRFSCSSHAPGPRYCWQTG